MALSAATKTSLRSYSVFLAKMVQVTVLAEHGYKAMGGRPVAFWICFMESGNMSWRKNAAGYIFALLATMVWAGNFVAARALAWEIPPCQFNFWRWVLAFVAIVPFAVPHLREDIAIARKKFGYMSFMAIVGVTLMNAFIYKAGQSTESLNMALLMPATPMVILLLARIVYGEPVTLRRLSGMLVACAGILVVISRGQWQKLAALEFAGGDLWTLGCMGCFATYSLFMRQRPQAISSVGFNFIVFGLGILYALPSVIVEMAYLPLPNFSFALVTGLLYAGLGCSALAFWLWTVGIDHIGPVRAGIIYYTLPIFAAIMGKIVLGEQIWATQVVGGCLIVLGIFTATIPWKGRRPMGGKNTSLP